MGENKATLMEYDQGTGPEKNWIVAESAFQRKYQGKAEVVMSLGNGYMGVRSCTEEPYIGQVRNHFVAGTFNKPGDNDVTELPNAADMTGLDIYINGELFSLEKGSYSNYKRFLSLKTGELNRSFTWEYESRSFHFEFQRFISMDARHLMASRVRITMRKGKADIRIESGINGQVTNTGAQHFEEGDKRIYDGEYVQMLQSTTESGIVFVHNMHHDFRETLLPVASRFDMDRRIVSMIYDCSLEAGQFLEFEKFCNVYTTRDIDMAGKDVEAIKSLSLNALKDHAKRGYENLLVDSASVWKDYWDRMAIEIEGENDFDQLAIRFAQYHLMIMTPRHDARCGIGAKGLSGEGYKGHSFWDTEIFMLPFFTYTFPEIARKLMEYRYITLEGARKKAKENGYRGAMYPWESAWADDGEVTPVWGDADIITGEAMKIWSGFIEQHITSDVAFAVWQYYMITGDEEFMKAYGYEILIDTGIFWSSRLEWNEGKGEYHINDVVGPDEYKEHVNNDAFTNHTARWCMENALNYYEHIKAHAPEVYERLKNKLNLEEEIPELRDRFDKVYLPQPNENGVIPQDDTYLSLKQIDLSKYRAQEHVGSIFKDFNLDQINEIQVSKQASVVMLMYLLEHKFDAETKKANYEYYEPRTLHDSSLSYSTHAVLAADIDDLELAYSMFERAARIDLGPKMKSSDHGIHAASLGGIWQILVCGFGGLRMIDGTLRINPKLPAQIHSISYPLIWKGNPMRVHITAHKISISNTAEEPVTALIQGEERTIVKEFELDYSKI